jgi:potassium-transporting ATPase KdpC subunit
MLKEIRTGVMMVLLVTVVAGGIFPAGMAGFAWLFFKDKGGGQVVVDEGGKVVGSRLIGQQFEDPVYFWGRPSVSKPAPYTPYDAKAGVSAGGSNMGPNDPRLVQAVKERAERYWREDPGNPAPVPVELVTASGSGLDPDISPAGAYYQARRVARLRGAPVEKINALIAAHVQARDLGVLGEERVNVLALNMALDGKFPVKR